MKSYIKITILATLSLFVVSCKKYLDQQPITSFGSEVVFADEKGAYEALIGVYSRLTGDQGYGKCLSLYYAVDNDETQGPGSTNDDARRGMSRYTLSSSNGELELPFNQLFAGIDYANICIDNIPKMSLYTNGSDLQKKRLQRMLGEAYTLRAQFYFDAIKIWGDLPAHFKPSYASAVADPFPTQTSRDTLYEHILADLQLATTLVPWKNELGAIGDGIDERINKATVKALRARIALFAGGYSLRNTGSVTVGEMKRRADYVEFYQIAKTECADIMASGQHNLNPSFKSLWKDQVGKRVVTDPDGELIFQVTGIGGSSAADTKLGYYNGPTVGNFGNKSINILPTYFYLFDSTDTRRDVTCVPYNVNSDGSTKVGTSITSINDGKYRRDWSNNVLTQNQWNGGKWQLIRYSDVLLMFAEAENELNGPTQLAYDAVNMVRRRGFAKPITTADPSVDLSGLTKDDFFKAITKERSLEFGGEGLRKYDLIRWNMLNTRINETKAELQKMANKTAPYNTLPTSMYFYNNATADDATVWANSLYKTAPSSTPSGTAKLGWVGSSTINSSTLARYAIGFTTGKSELFPLPLAALNANKNLTQNPGY